MELVGFVSRVFPKSHKTSSVNLPPVMPANIRDSVESLIEDSKSSISKFLFYTIRKFIY